MITLQDILDAYTEDFEQKKGDMPVTGATVSDHKIVAGLVMERYFEAEIPFTVVVLRVRGEVADVALMSYAWELGTEKDMVVRIPHALRDVWLVELDRIFTVPMNTLGGFYPVTELDSGDLDLAMAMLSGKREALPHAKRGTGSFLPVKQRFKKFELERSQWLLGEMLDWVEEEEQPAGIIEMDLEIQSDVHQNLEQLAQELPAAASSEDFFQNQWLAGVYSESDNKLKLVVHEEYQGRYVKLIMDLPMEKVTLFKGYLKKNAAFLLGPMDRRMLGVMKQCLKVSTHEAPRDPGSFN